MQDLNHAAFLSSLLIKNWGLLVFTQNNKLHRLVVRDGARAAAPFVFIILKFVLWRFQKVWIILLCLNQLLIFSNNFFFQLFFLVSLVSDTLIDKTIVKVSEFRAILIMINLLVPSSLETSARHFMQQVSLVLPMPFFVL